MSAGVSAGVSEAGATRASYDAVAGRYAAEVGDELRGKALDRALLGLVVELAAGGTIGDLGCGPAHVAAHLASLGARVVGLDLSPVMCALGRRLTGLGVAAGDLAALPLRSGSVAAVVCAYAVIHLDEAARVAAYAGMARVLAPGGHALVAFHTADGEIATGGALHLREWWESEVELTFRFLDPVREVALLAAAGLPLVARLDRAPLPGVEHPSHRSYVLVRREPASAADSDAELGAASAGLSAAGAGAAGSGAGAGAAGAGPAGAGPAGAGPAGFGEAGSGAGGGAGVAGSGG